MDYNFKSGLELEANYAGLKISQVMLKREALLQSLDEESLKKAMKGHLEIMKESLERGLQGSLKSMGGLVENAGALLMAHFPKSLGGGSWCQAAAFAMAVTEQSACMGRLVAAPTAGAGGIIPGVFFSLGAKYGWDDDKLTEGLFAASAIGYLIAKDATLAGAEGGCQAETGSAAAMAAAALVEMAGGHKSQALNGAAIALIQVMGLVCDPVAGLVEVPCVKRNAIGAANAILSADMALAGCTSQIPFDQVVAAMGRVGKALPESLRETGQGGIAATPWAVEVKESLGIN